MLAALLLNLLDTSEYPDLGQHPSTRIIPIPGLRLVAAPNGQLSSQARAADIVYQITCVHGLCTLAELETLQAFYAARYRSRFTWTAAESGETYFNVVFTGIGVDWAPRAGGRFWVQTTMQSSP